MKTKATMIASMLFTLTAGAQTVNVHLKSGEVVKYDSSVFDYIDFSMAESETPVAYTECPDGNHPHMIDLGLPSGTKWACCNVGASAPEQYGGYYAWGEVHEKDVYGGNTYAYYNSGTGYVNIGSDIAGTGYDAATANWGVPWRMPSLPQIKELVNNCSSTWTTQNGVKGRKITGPNGGTIFLPAAGRWLSDPDEADKVGTIGYYWSSTLSGNYSDLAQGLQCGSGPIYWYDSDYRDMGRTVRPVR